MDKSKKETAKNRRMANITGNIGLHYACYRLSLLGLNVMPTARNTKGVDILVHDYECKKIVAVQVKTRAVNTGVQICLRKEPNPIDKVLGDFWIVVPLFRKVKGSGDNFQTATDALQEPGKDMSVEISPAIIVPAGDIRDSIKRDDDGLVVKDKRETGSWWLTNYAWWPSGKDKDNFAKYAKYREAWDLIRKQVS